MGFHKNRWSIRQDRFVALATEVINRQMPKLLKLAPNINNQNKVVRGRSYEFKDGECIIRDDAGGHKYPDNPSQNRGPHFNDGAKNHYDYKE